MGNPSTVKTTGAIWNLFYADKTAWPEGAYHDDTLVAVNGKEDPDADLDALPLDAQIEIKCGYVVFPDRSDADLGEHFLKWEALQAKQGQVFGTFRVPTDKLEAVHQAILAAGGELVK